MRAITFLAGACLVAAALSACSPPESAQSPSTPDGGSPTQSATAGAETGPEDIGSSPSASPGQSTAASPSPGALVTEFPADLLPVIPASRVLSSSVDQTGDMAVVSFTAAADKTAKEIIDYYRSALEKAGFKELKDGISNDSVTSQDFVRDSSETINVSVVPGGEGELESVYTVGGTLLPESMD